MALQADLRRKILFGHSAKFFREIIFLKIFLRRIEKSLILF